MAEREHNPATPEAKQMLRAQEVAKLMDVSQRMMQLLTPAGEPVAIRIGRKPD